MFSFIPSLKRLPLGPDIRDPVGMPDITNLRLYRKKQARDDKRAEADKNAAKFGQSKAAKLLSATRDEHSRKMLDQHRLTDLDDE